MPSLIKSLDCKLIILCTFLYKFISNLYLIQLMLGKYFAFIELYTYQLCTIIMIGKFIQI